MTGHTTLPSGVKILRDGDRLSVRALGGNMFYGGAVAATGLFVLVVLTIVAIQEGVFDRVIAAVALGGIALVALGVLIAWPRVTLTTFDLAQASVHQASGRWHQKPRLT